MGRDEEHNRRMREDRRRRILSEAVRLFATRGLGATRVGDIAAAAGMSQGLLYHYFASKEEIFTDIVPTFAPKWRKPLVSLNTAKTIGTTKGASRSA